MQYYSHGYGALAVSGDMNTCVSYEFVNFVAFVYNSINC